MRANIAFWGVVGHLAFDVVPYVLRTEQEHAVSKEMALVLEALCAIKRNLLKIP